jgi:hypothetical protein
VIFSSNSPFVRFRDFFQVLDLRWQKQGEKAGGNRAKSRRRAGEQQEVAGRKTGGG